MQSVYSLSGILHCFPYTSWLCRSTERAARLYVYVQCNLGAHQEAEPPSTRNSSPRALSCSPKLGEARDKVFWTTPLSCSYVYSGATTTSELSGFSRVGNKKQRLGAPGEAVPERKAGEGGAGVAAGPSHRT